VRTPQGDADRSLVALDDRVLNTDLHIGDRSSYRPQEDFEAVRAMQVFIAFAQAVGDPTRGKEFVCRFFPALIPDLVEPALYDRASIV
jgi:hypothetical protein